MQSHRFAYLFVGLLAMLAAEPLIEVLHPDGRLLLLAFTLTLVVGVWSLQGSRRLFRAGLGLTLLALLTSGGYAYSALPAARLINIGVIAVFCAITIALASQQVLLAAGAVTLNRIMGALCVYLLLGTLWSALYALCEAVLPHAFHYGSAGPGALPSRIYYSFVTLTTLGYGDVTPVHPVARTLSYLEAVTGQLYLAVLVASLVGRYQRALREEEASG